MFQVVTNISRTKKLTQFDTIKKKILTNNKESFIIRSKTFYVTNLMII
jgi:hypothetical protein